MILASILFLLAGVCAVIVIVLIWLTIGAAEAARKVGPGSFTWELHVRDAWVNAGSAFVFSAFTYGLIWGGVAIW